MLENISVFHFLIFATCFGFIVAIIYTNIQRTALSKFVSYLVSNKIFDSESAANCEKIGMKKIEKTIIKSAVKSQNGLKKCICVIKPESESVDKFEQAIAGSRDDMKFYLKECDTELLMKRYSFKPMETKQVLLFIAALIAVVIASTLAVDWLIEKVTIPEIENSDEAPSASDDAQLPSDSVEPETDISDNSQSEDNATDDETGDDVETPEDNNNNGPVVPY